MRRKVDDGPRWPLQVGQGLLQWQKARWGKAVAGSGLVRAEMHGDVQVIWLASAPGNLFGPPLCNALLAALQAAFSNAATGAVVLASALQGPGQGFSGGIDLGDLRRAWPAGAATPGDIVRLMLTGPRAVIAALHGPTLGAGAEIALAARGRIAAPDLRFGLRDMLVGRLPMAGATQTLPRLVGAAEALRLIGKGTSLSAVEALAMGIVDQITEGDLMTAALAMAQNPPVAARAPGLRDGRGYQAAITQARSSTAGDDAALLALCECIEAAQLLPQEQGLDFEAEAAAEIATRPEAAALQHLMTAEMRMVADLQGGHAVPQIGLWGAGAAPLIWPALRAGISVVLADDDRPALLDAVEKLAMAQEELVAAGRLTAATRDAEWARLRPSVSAGDLADCAMVIAAKPGAEGRVVAFGTDAGLAPAEARLVLVAPGFAELQLAGTDRGFALTVAATLRQMRMRLAVTKAPPDGGVTRAMVLAAQTAIRVLRQIGVGRGAILAALDGQLRLPVAVPDAVSGPVQTMPASAIRARVLGAVVAEGARLLAQGAARRAGILDALAATALGMPRHLGGPLLMADQRGLLLVRRDLQAWQQDHAIWAPPELLDQLISDSAALSAWEAAR